LLFARLIARLFAWSILASQDKVKQILFSFSAQRKIVVCVLMQTKTDAAAFAVRVRASHKLGTLTGIRTKDAGRTDREELELSLAGKLWPHSSSNRLMSC